MSLALSPGMSCNRPRQLMTTSASLSVTNRVSALLSSRATGISRAAVANCTRCERLKRRATAMTGIPRRIRSTDIVYPIRPEAPRMRTVIRWPLQARLGDHQPNDRQHRAKCRKAGQEPESKQPMIVGTELVTMHKGLACEIAHAHLHPQDRQPERTRHNIESNRDK